jgi:dephospho-CoA kinase
MATLSSNLHSDQFDLGDFKGQILLVGLTGGIGSGKTAVSDLLGQLGAGVIDTDLISHQITAPNGKAIPAIRHEFGPEFINNDGALDRPKMRALVFAQPEARKTLEVITHPLIRQEAVKQAEELSKAGVPYLVFAVPLLIESKGWQNLVDYLVVVDCPEEVQIERVMHRNNLSREEVKKILAAQTSRQERLACANAVIENQGSPDQLASQVRQLNQKILQIQKDLLSSS